MHDCSDTIQRIEELNSDQSIHCSTLANECNAILRRETSTKQQRPAMPESKQSVRLRLTTAEGIATVKALPKKLEEPLLLQSQTFPRETQIIETVALRAMGEDAGSETEQII